MFLGGVIWRRMKCRWRFFFVTVANTCFMSFGTLRILSCALKWTGEGGKPETVFAPSFFQRAASYHLFTAVSSKNIRCKSKKPSFIFPRDQPFRCKLIQLHRKIFFVQRNCQVRGEEKEESDEFPFQFPSGRALLKCQSSSTGLYINRWQTAFLVFASHSVNHRLHLVWPLFFLNRWKYMFIMDCSKEMKGL